MAQHPGKHARAAEQVQVHTADGTIGINSPALFAAGDEQPLHALIERLFQSSAVEAIALDRIRSAVEIRYDRSAMNVQTALRNFSTSLLAPEPTGEPRASHAGSLLRPYLERLLGRVKLVERRRHSGLATESTVVVEDLIVEFDPIPEGAPGVPAGAVPLAPEMARPWVGEVVVGGVRRMANLAAAGGCFVMSIVGVITPGIPTVPFVLATGYFLARSSPRLHERFRRSRFFGQMVSDYEDHGGLRWSTKFKMILFTVGLMVVTIVIAGATLPLLIAVGAMGTIGIYLLGRIPTVRSAAHPAS
jgi:uncharacterized protein